MDDRLDDPRKYAPSVARNRDFIVEVLRGVLPRQGDVLEIASGSGEHVVYFAEKFPRLTFLPSDPDEAARSSICAWIEAARLNNVRAPIALDASLPLWPVAKADAIICINMTHISAWSATEGLFKGAALMLDRDAPLVLYGPYKRNGAYTAESNHTFDDWLRGQNPNWGVRDLEAVEQCGFNAEFSTPEIIEMPANNLSLVFRRRGPG